MSANEVTRRQLGGRIDSGRQNSQGIHNWACEPAHVRMNLRGGEDRSRKQVSVLTWKGRCDGLREQASLFIKE